MRRLSPKIPGNVLDNRESTSGNTLSIKEADERRLRKLKGFLKSVSYNGSEGMQFETLNDIYGDALLLDRPPCIDLLTLGEFKCNPTPFLVSSCFNRTQVDTNAKGRHRGSRKTVKKMTPNRSRKIPTPIKNATPLAEIYGKMDGKEKKIKPTPFKKQGITKGKVGSVEFGQGRRSSLDAAVETAVQSGRSQTTLMKNVEDEQKEEKEIKSKNESPKKETSEEKNNVRECAKERGDEDKTRKQTKTEGKKLKSDEMSKKKEEITNETKEDKLNWQESKKEQDQKSSDITQTSTSGKSGKKGYKESKSGKSAKKSHTTNIEPVTGKTSFAEARINEAKKKQDFEKSSKSDDKGTNKPNTSGSYKEEKQPHLKGAKSSVTSPVASTSTENTTPTTRLKVKSKTNDAVNKAGRQLRLRRERPLTYSHKTTVSPDRKGNKYNGHGYSIRKRHLKKTNTR